MPQPTGGESPTCGLRKRIPAELTVAIGGNPARPQAALHWLLQRGLRPVQARRPEVEFLFLPGRGRFSGRADVNVLVGDDPPRSLLRKAHLLIAERPTADFPEEHRFAASELSEALAMLE